MNFKVNDRVKIVEKDEALEDIYGVPFGAEGTVLEVDSENEEYEIHVEFDEVYSGEIEVKDLYLPKRMFCML